MTGLPKVDITILNNQIGAVAATDDNVMGIVLSGIGTVGLAVSTPKQVFSLEEVEALGFTAAYDTTNTTDVYKQLKDFYTLAPKGTELWFMVIPKTTTMETACDKNNDVVKKLLNAANGRINVWGITRTPDGAYEPSFDDGFDDDASAAVLKAHALSEQMSDEDKPIRCLVGARDFQSVVGDLKDLKTMTQNRVGMVIGSIHSTGEPAVGFALGKLGAIPVQRKMSRVKDGDVVITQAYLTDGNPIEDYEASADAIHNKGYIFFRKFTRKSGYYFNGDHMCCADSDDYSSMSRGRVIDKAHRITFDVYTNEIEDDIKLDPNGYIDPAKVKSYQQLILDALDAQMVQTGNASGVICEIDPKQNVAATNTVAFKKVGARPVGYSTYITIPLGYDNPLNK